MGSVEEDHNKYDSCINIFNFLLISLSCFIYIFTNCRRVFYLSVMNGLIDRIFRTIALETP